MDLSYGFSSSLALVILQAWHEWHRKNFDVSYPYVYSRTLVQIINGKLFLTMFITMLSPDHIFSFMQYSHHCNIMVQK